MFDISIASSTLDPNKSSLLDPKKELTHEQKSSINVPATATEDKEGERTSRSRIKSHFQVRETSTEHVSMFSHYIFLLLLD